MHTIREFAVNKDEFDSIHRNGNPEVKCFVATNYTNNDPYTIKDTRNSFYRSMYLM